MVYGLDFSGASSRRVVIALPSWSNLAAATFLVRARISVPNTNGRLMTRGLNAGGHLRNMSIAGTGANFDCSIQRSTTSLNVVASLANFAAWAASTWLTFAFAFDINGVNADQKLYIGSDTVACAEPSAYSTQQVGSGALGDDSAQAQYIGNFANANGALPGQESVVSVYDSALSATDIERWNKRPSRFIVPGCKLFVALGLDGSTGTQLDWTTNNNHGTVTGATASASQDPRIIRVPHALLTGVEMGR